MNDQERAEEHLKTIRRLMERATIYRAISAPTALVGGMFSLVASAMYPLWRRHSASMDTPDNDRLFLWLWLLVLLFTFATNTLYIVAGAKRRNEPVFSPSMKAALIALTPPFLFAATITFCDVAVPGWNYGISVVWAACYGLGLLATSHFAPRSLTLLGWAFFLSGIAGIILASSVGYWFDSLAAYPASLFMAVTFGLYHLIYAICVWPRDGSIP
jgi:hypothetical protein